MSDAEERSAPVTGAPRPGTAPDPAVDAEALRRLAADLLVAGGLDRPLAERTGELLLEADLMGHPTHGLALLPWYLGSLAEGVMTPSGEPEVLSDRGAVAVWDGRRLPGPWLTATALEQAVERARRYGTATLTIGNSHHIACLAAYLPIATDAGMMAVVASSSPSGAQVAPYGGLRGVFTPDPIAVGIPTSADPVLVDISASTTTANLAAQLVADGAEYEHEWLMDREGGATRDPRVLAEGGTILPLGGLELGHKGYGLAVFVEALTQGLAGFGRADAPHGTNASVTVQVHDPEAFAGAEAFTRQTDWLVQACRSSPPRPGVRAVRMPGERALRLRRERLAGGVPLGPAIVDGLRSSAAQLGVDAAALEVEPT